MTTQPSTSKLPDNPVSCECKEANWRMYVLEKTGLLRVDGGRRGGGEKVGWSIILNKLSSMGSKDIYCIP